MIPAVLIALIVAAILLAILWVILQMLPLPANIRLIIELVACLLAVVYVLGGRI